MKIQLWDKPNDSYSAEQQILHNRGVKNIDSWLEGSQNEQQDWSDLDYYKMLKAVGAVKNVIDNNGVINIIVDPDCDGNSATALFINYFHSRYPDYGNIVPIFHDGKQHGFSDIMDKFFPDVNLIVSPDGGTNNVQEHIKLYEQGIDVICLDHHDVSADMSESPANIINVQCCDGYRCKEITGSVVTWRFCQAYEYIIFGKELEDFSDLAALGMIGDMADSRELEIRSIELEGLSNIKNHFFLSLLDAHQYVVEKRNGVNYNSVAFSVVPWINAVNRSGTQEEKQFVFEAMLDEYADTIVPNSKRGHKGEMCRRCEEAVTVAERVKRRQTQIQEQETGIVKRKIEENDLDDHSIILALLEPDEGEPNINGLTATQISAKYQKPSAVLIRKETDQGVSWVGSMRNAPNAEKDDLRAELEKTGEVEFVAGHSNAGGLEIKDENIQEFLRRFDEQYKDVDMERRFMVDYDWSMGRVDERKILDIAHLNIYGQGIPESLVSVHDINLSSCKIQLLGARRNTVKITLPNDVSIMKFQTDEDFFDSLSGDDKYLNIVGKPGDNFYNGVHYPQIVMEDYEILDDWYVF